jgi:hypothetical protein
VDARPAGLVEGVIYDQSVLKLILIYFVGVDAVVLDGDVLASDDGEFFGRLGVHPNKHRVVIF